MWITTYCNMLIFHHDSTTSYFHILICSNFIGFDIQEPFICSVLFLPTFNTKDFFFYKIWARVITGTVTRKRENLLNLGIGPVMRHRYPVIGTNVVQKLGVSQCCGMRRQTVMRTVNKLKMCFCAEQGAPRPLPRGGQFTQSTGQQGLPPSYQFPSGRVKFLQHTLIKAYMNLVNSIL